MEQPLFRKDHSVHPFGNYRLTVTAPSLRSSLLLGLSLNLLFTACPDNNNPPPIADCDPGWHPCETDSTECCLDTTSHNFVWEIDTLGDYGSYLNDVAIIDENNIWVVGEIRTESGKFNAAHWNGEEWELVVIQPEQYLFGQYTSVFGFESNDVWFGSSIVVHWDGNSFSGYGLNEGYPGGFYVKAIWGTSSTDIYFVGGNGSIVHYDGSGFEKMESGTDVDLLDIDGTRDGEHVFAVGWDATLPAPCVVLEFTNGIWNTLYYTEGSQPNNGNVGWVWGVGVINNMAYFPTSAGLWKYNFTDQDSVLIPNSISHMNRSAFKSVHINSVNDIFFAGSGFQYIHFNGSTYHYSQEITDMYTQRAMWGANYKNGLAVMVGMFDSFSHALVAKGHHE